MTGILRLFLFNMWEKSKGPGDLYVWFFIFTLMVAYASLFSFFVEIFGTTTRVFPAIYLAIAATSWGIRGAIPATILNVALNLFLYKHTGRSFEGGILGPLGCLFATCLVGMISDLARQLEHQLRQRQALEAVLKDSEKRYRRIFNMASDAILLIDDETGRIVEANESASRMYGYSHDEFVQMNGIDISTQPDDTYTAIQKHKKHVPVRYHKKKSGIVFPTEITAEQFSLKGRQVHVIAIRDITSRLKADEEKKRLEAQFYQAQKMESIGTLAGGIAHDFNNLLGGIMGHTSLGFLKIKPGDPSYKHLKTIEKLAKSGGKLTKHILGFARGGKYEVKKTDLNELISQHNLIFGPTHKHITIDERFDDNLWIAEVDQEQIEQVLFNIYLNAVQAMPEKGNISVTTENTLLSRASGFPFQVKPGEYIKITIQDNGIGMNETAKYKIFEPFYSTKEKDVGTGLGMAAAYGIVKNHGGYIHVISELGCGTTIIILLPCSEKTYKTDVSTPVSTLETGTGTIMVVDDEEDILKVVTEMIQMMGYETLSAKSGSDAVSLFRKKNKEIDLVILDMIMPGMNGEATLKKLNEIDENVKVLFQTGYSQKHKKGMEFVKANCGVIQKPFTLNALSVKIKRALNSSQEILFKEKPVPPIVSYSANIGVNP